MTAAAVSPHRLDQRPLDLGAGGRAAGVHHPRHRVPALPGQGQPARGVEVEHRAQGDQVLHPAGALVDEDAHGVDVAQAGAGGQGVGQVEVGGVGVAAQHGGDAPLGPAGGGLVEVGLGQHPHPHAVVGGGGLDRGREAGHPTAEDEQVELAGRPSQGCGFSRRRP